MTFVYATLMLMLVGVTRLRRRLANGSPEWLMREELS
jgi:hypothetical protein